MEDLNSNVTSEEKDVSVSGAPSVTIYTTPTCVYCKMTKEYFKENNVEYTEKNVTTDEGARNEMVDKSGQMGVPVVDVDGKFIVGFDKEKLAELIGIK